MNQGVLGVVLDFSVVVRDQTKFSFVSEIVWQLHSIRALNIRRDRDADLPMVPV